MTVAPLDAEAACTLDLASTPEIGCLMMFPADSKKRKQFFEATSIRLAEDFGLRPVPSSWPEIRAALKAEEGLLTRDQTDEMVKNSHREGSIAGTLLYHIVGT